MHMVMIYAAVYNSADNHCSSMVRPVAINGDVEQWYYLPFRFEHKGLVRAEQCILQQAEVTKRLSSKTLAKVALIHVRVEADFF